MSQVEKRRMCPQCRAFITTDDKVCPYCNNEVAPRAVDRRTPADALGGLIPHARFTTMMILLINFGLYAATVLHTNRVDGVSGFDPDSRSLVDFGAKYLPAIAAGQWWRLITAGFLHGGVWHILMNSWVLFDLGVQVEQTFGTARFLIIYFIANITGYWTSLYFSPNSLSIGASAAIFGLIGAMIAMGIRDRSSYGTAIRGVYVRWAVYGLMMGLLPGIDNLAHVGGLAGGFLTAFIIGTPGYSRTIERLWKVAAGFALMITVAAFLLMFRSLMATQ
jgi:rhomboid protease GluP